MHKKLLDFLLHTGLLAAGSALCAVAVNGILVPHNFLSSGLTGVALLLFYKWHALPLGALYLLCALPVFLLGWFFMGLRFVLYTAWGMLIYSLMLYVPMPDLGIADKMLAAAAAGGLTGVGVAVMSRSYGSAGGSEMLFAILHKLFGLTLGAGTLLFNAAVLGAALFFFSAENVLYTMVFIVVTALATDKVFHGLATRQAALIVSERWREIAGDLTANARLGATLLRGSGGRGGSEKTIIYSVIRRGDIHALKTLAAARDPNAFIVIMDAADVTGVRVGNQPLW
ncbi:MAG: YitT family protein [Elusimicrobiales bacterium]